MGTRVPAITGRPCMTCGSAVIPGNISLAIAVLLERMSTSVRFRWLVRSSSPASYGGIVSRAKSGRHDGDRQRLRAGGVGRSLGLPAGADAVEPGDGAVRGVEPVCLFDRVMDIHSV